jgi:hypothetical protein
MATFLDKLLASQSPLVRQRIADLIVFIVLVGSLALLSLTLVGRLFG